MKAAIYCRLSEEDRDKKRKTDESESIHNQKELLKEYAAKKGWEVYQVYTDEDYGGSDRTRPAFGSLLADAEEKKFDIVLCKTQSRFTREVELVEKYIHGLFPIWGIRFVSVVDNADTANEGNKKARQINALVNEWYLEDMSESIRSVLDDKRKKGLHIGSFALYGYKKDPHQKGRIIIDPEAASVVKKIYAMAEEGFTVAAIAECLNRDGILNPTAYKQKKGLRYRQVSEKTLWRGSGVSSILRNRMYTGTMVQGRQGSVSYKLRKNGQRPKEKWFIVENTHEPIIERERWEAVQNRGRGTKKNIETVV